jgi:hypothetical protein
MKDQERREKEQKCESVSTCAKLRIHMQNREIMPSSSWSSAAAAAATVFSFCRRLYYLLAQGKKEEMHQT